jgi:hypothetical protein
LCRCLPCERSHDADDCAGRPCPRDGCATGRPVATVPNHLRWAAGELTTTTYYNKFADLDAGNPAIAVVGEAAATAMTAKAGTLATNVQVIVRRRVADLSF